MTKDLTQQGLQTVSATNVGATLDNNGKLGKCYSFNGNGNYLLFNYGLPKTVNTWSYCCWAKLVNNSTTMCLYSQRTTTTDDQRTIFIVQGKVFYFDDGVRIQGSLNTSADLTQWNHYAFIRNGNSLKIYINGIETVSTTISSTPATVGSYTMIGASQSANTTPSGNSLYGYLNDIRLYDHALSPKEIEILSRGLVCHYPLTGGGRGGDNLLKNTGDLTLWAKEAGITTTWDSEKNLYKIVDSTHTSNRWGIYQDINIEANTSYTITCTLNGDNCAVAFGFYDSSTSFPGNLITVTDSTTKRLSYTVTSGASSTKARVYLNMNCANSATKTAWFGTPKVEKGSVSTPWMPNSADTAYSAMGYNSTTEYDVSGYGYNGTKNGTIAYSTDTPRYNVSTNIKGASSYIQIPNLTTTGFNNSYSFAWWGKVPSYQGYMMWGFSDGQRLNGIFNGNLWNTGDGASNPLYIPGTTTQVTVPTVNVWHHWVMTGDGTTCKVYQDGVLWGQAKTYKSISGTTIYINGWDAGTSYTYGDYQMSDFRIYATALSATQVAELYNTAVSVANNGTLLGYELVEV